MDLNEFEIEMIKQCPNLYKCMLFCGESAYYEPIYEFGFEINPGWYALLRDLSLKLEKLIVQIPEAERQKYVATQVKQKYGSFIFIMDAVTDDMKKLIGEAEHIADQTCEVCGKPGELRSTAWIRVLCENHYQNFK